MQVTRERIRRVVAELPFFWEAPPELVDAAASQATLHDLRPGAALADGHVHASFVARGLWGRLYTNVSGQDCVRLVGHGEPLLPASVVGGTPRCFETVAVTDTLVVTLGAEPFRELLSHHNWLTERLLRHQQESWELYWVQEAEFRALPCDQRVRSVLLELRRYIREDRLPVSQYLVAALAGVSRVHAAMALDEL